MCVKKQEFLNLCELFPSTAENLKRKAKERRCRFMQQKSTNSKKYFEIKQQKRRNKEHQYDTEESFEEEDFEGFQTDEDHERKDDGQEEMKDFLDQLHSRIDTLDKALQEADQMITESTAEENMLKRVQERRAKGQVMINSVAEFFKDKIKQKDRD